MPGRQIQRYSDYPIFFSSFFNQPPAFFSIFSAPWSKRLGFGALLECL